MAEQITDQDVLNTLSHFQQVKQRCLDLERELELFTKDNIRLVAQNDMFRQENARLAAERDHYMRASTESMTSLRAAAMLLADHIKQAEVGPYRNNGAIHREQEEDRTPLPRFLRQEPLHVQAEKVLSSRSPGELEHVIAAVEAELRGMPSPSTAPEVQSQEELVYPPDEIQSKRPLKAWYEHHLTFAPANFRTRPGVRKHLINPEPFKYKSLGFVVEQSSAPKEDL